jgi:hypothetical protein
MENVDYLNQKQNRAFVETKQGNIRYAPIRPVPMHKNQFLQVTKLRYRIIRGLHRLKIQTNKLGENLVMTHKTKKNKLAAFAQIIRSNLHSLVANNSNANMRGQNHRHIIGAIPDCHGHFAYTTLDQLSHLCVVCAHV